MGFQPEGDLPDGIVIPPPVEGKTVNSIWYIFNTSTNNYLLTLTPCAAAAR